VNRWRFKFCTRMVVFLLGVREQVLLARVIIDCNPDEYTRQINEEPSKCIGLCIIKHRAWGVFCFAIAFLDLFFML
jgi:hypothetical protein